MRHCFLWEVRPAGLGDEMGAQRLARCPRVVPEPWAADG